MGKVRLEISPSFVGVLNAENSDWFILDKEIGEGATLCDLLAELAFSHTDFRKVIFDPDTGKVSDQVLFVLNNNLLEFHDLTDAKLKDGDTVVLVPVYAGG